MYTFTFVAAKRETESKRVSLSVRSTFAMSSGLPPAFGQLGRPGFFGIFFFFLISTSGRNRGLEARGDQLGEDLEFTLEGASWCQGFLSPGTAESLP